METPIPHCCNIRPCKFRDRDFNRCLIFAKMLSINPEVINESDKSIFPIVELKEMLQSKIKTLLNVNSEMIMIKSLAQVIISEYTKCIIQISEELEMSGNKL